MTCNPDHKYYLGGKQVPKSAYEVWDEVCRQLAETREQLDALREAMETADKQVFAALQAPTRESLFDWLKEARHTLGSAEQKALAATRPAVEE